MSLSSEILDEIALEGLDGVTIEALWVRLQNRKGFLLPPTDEHSKVFLWNIVRKLRDVEYYQLKEPRQPLVVFDRWSHLQDDLGMVVEPPVLPVDIYPHCLISDAGNKIQGSCSTYYSREDVTNQVRKLQLGEVLDKFGAERITIVANQEIRRKTLMGSHHNPHLEFTDFQYCCLERVGRSRYHGEVTQGRMGLQVLGVDPKTIFYFRKFLLKQKLITKQVFHIRTNNTHITGRLIHLPRFYRLVKPKYLTLTENIIEFLMTQPDYMCEVGKLRESLGITCSLKKLTKIPDFQKYVKTDAKVPYRSVYPQADTKDWKLKANDKEKRVRVLYLVDPAFDMKEIQSKLEGNDEDDDDDDEEDGETHSQGFLDQSKRCYDRSIVLQVLKTLENAGPNGLSASELTEACGMSKLNMRALCKYLVKSNLIGSFLADFARQRVTRFFLNSGNKVCDVTSQFNSEEKKFLNLTQDKATEDCLETISDGIAAESIIIDDDNVSRVTENETMEVIDGSCVEVEKKGEERIAQSIVEKGKIVEEEKGIEKVIDEKTDDVVEEGSKGDGEAIVQEKREEEEILKPGLNVLKSHSSNKSKKRPMDADKESPVMTKKTKLRVKSVADLNNERGTDDVTGNSETVPIDVDLDSSPVETTDLEMSLLEHRVKGQTDASDNVSSKDDDSHNIDIEITDSLDWLLARVKARGYLKRDFDGNISTDGYKTVRSLKRWNLILQTVQSHKVITNLKNIHTVIEEAESKEGINTRIDRKSLLRILYKMATDKLIKVYKAVLKSADTMHEINFICSSTITPDHPLIKFSIDLAKLKFTSKIKLQNDTIFKQEGKSDDIFKNEEMVLTNKFDFTEKHKSNLDVPKFMRMRYLHIFMYYLVYGYEGSVDLDQKEAANQIKTSLQGIAVDDLESSSFIYVASANWKMFVPPLPQHREYKSGWALLADVILRLPLSMFLQLVRLPYIIPNIDLYLDHPIKRHMLVKDLPVPIRNCLTLKRKYVFSICEVMHRLAYIGLVQLGPQSFKEKDHVYVYLNKNALLLDTKNSRPGYHKVSDDLTYEELRYHFDEMMDVERYWLDMWKICMHTKLGSRSCVIGTELILENIHDKPDMVDIMIARSRDEVKEKDVGYLPGDKLGAAGFDSALFSHLKRNWSFKMFPKSRQTVITIPEKPSTGLKRPFKSSEGKNQMVYSLLAKRRKNLIITARRQTNTTTVHRKQLLSKKPRVTVRHVKPKRNLKHRRPFYDQVDREALQRMNKLRVDWSKAEDKLLLLCKVVTLMIAPPKSTILGNMYVSTREILHNTFPSSRNKTSRACQRRTNYMLKSQSTCHSLNLCIEELRHDPTIMQEYGDLFNKLKAKHENKTKLVAEWNVHFKNLFEILAKRYDNFSMLSLSSGSSQTLPDTLEEFYANYYLIEPTKKVKLKPRFNPVESINDVYCSVINSTIHSALCCSSDKTSWSYHLFSVYQQYPEKLLRLSLAKMRTSMMVSLKRAWARTKMRSGNYLPLTASPYRLSITYINMMTAKHTPDIFAECFEQLHTFVQSKRVEIQSQNGGTTAGVVQMLTENLVDFEIGIPDQVIVLNPNVPEKDEKYTRLMERYQEILSSYKQELKTTSCLFQKDNYSTVNNIEDESDTYTISNNTIARTASRIALYLVRDSEEVGGTMPHDLQHVHDFFVVTPCTIISNLKPTSTDDDLEVITDMREIVKFQKHLKENAIFPANLMIDVDVNEVLLKHLPNDRIDRAVKLLELAKSEGNLGLMCDRIVKEFGNSLEVKQILDKLCKLKLLVCTGVVYTTYVHFKHVRPWLVHTYQNKRYDRDSRQPMIGGVMELETEEDEEDEESVQGREKNHTSSRLLPGEDKGRIDEDATKERKSECDVENDMLVVEHEDEERSKGNEEKMFVVDVIIGKTEDKVGNKEKNYVNAMEVSCGDVIQAASKFDEVMRGSDLVEEGLSGCGKVVQENEKNIVEGFKERNSECLFNEEGHAMEVDGEKLVQEEIDEGLEGKNTGNSSRKEVCEVEVSGEKLVRDVEKEFDKGGEENDLKSSSGVEERVENVENENVGEGSSKVVREGDCDKDEENGRLGSRKSVRLHKGLSCEEEISRKPEASTSEPYDTDCRNLSQPIKVLVRPWVKVDGSINRRALDHLLSVVLSHIMLHPLTTLAEVQERFLPALQPQHTRELAEALQQIKCLQSFICEKIGRASLFSEPCAVVLKEATGLEPATDIRYEANKEAIINLGKFISTKKYDLGFLVALANR